MIVSFIVAQLAKTTLPEPLRKVAAWAIVVVAGAALAWGAKAAYDASVVADHEAGKAIESIDARDVAAEARATDSVVNTTNHQEMTDAIQSVPAADAQLRADCLRLARLNRYPGPCGRYRGN